MEKSSAPELKIKRGALVIDSTDNVAVALCDLKEGEDCIIRIGEKEEKITANADILFGHKIARFDLHQNERVYKYGEEIGKMKESVNQGEWIHTHNMYCERGFKKHGR